MIAGSCRTDEESRRTGLAQPQDASDSTPLPIRRRGEATTQAFTNGAVSEGFFVEPGTAPAEPNPDYQREMDPFVDDELSTEQKIAGCAERVFSRICG